MKTWQVIIISLLSGLLMAGIILLVASPPRGQVIQLSPPPTTSPVIVYITGAIKQPGVYNLPANSRLEDAIRAAQGMSPLADLASINLAAPVHDGEHIIIPLQGESTPTPQNNGTQSTASAGTYSSVNPLNINLAQEAELELLPGIGPTRAAAIIAYREAHGPFVKVDDIQNVPGIGPETFKRLKDIITVN